MNEDFKQVIHTLLTTSGPLGILAVLVWLEVQEMSSTLTAMSSTLAVCVAQQQEANNAL